MRGYPRLNSFNLVTSQIEQGASDTPNNYAITRRALKTILIYAGKE